MADYNVNWFLNEYPLPVIGQSLAEELVASGKCTSQNCPNTARTQKGPEPAKIILTVPYSVISTVLADDLDGTHKLLIKWDQVDPSSGLELPPTEVLFECLYVVHVSEVIKHRDNIVQDDLVIVELSDVRHVFQKFTSYGSYQIPSNASFTKTAAHQIYNNSFKHLTRGSKAVNVTEEVFPEQQAGVLSYLNQFSVDEHKSDWELFNDCCNRTENSFFIAYDGEPFIQKNSRHKNYPFSAPRHGYGEKYEFLNDSEYSETLGDLNLNHLDGKWDAANGFFWTTQAKSNFTKITRPFNELNSPPYSKVVNVFPLSIPISSYSYAGFSAHYRKIVDTYIWEINRAQEFDKWVVCYNGVLRADLESQISTVMYTNNPNGVFTYVDVKFRHGIPFYEFEGPFQDEFVPTAWASLSAIVHPRNWFKQFDPKKGLNALCPPKVKGGGMLPPAQPVGVDCITEEACPYTFNFMGFYGNGPVDDPEHFEIPYRYGKADRITNHGIRTNYPKFFRTLSGNIAVSKTGYYRIGVKGTVTITSAGTLCGPVKHKELILQNNETPTGSQGETDYWENVQDLGLESLQVQWTNHVSPVCTLVNQNGGDFVDITIPIPCVHFPQNIRPQIVPAGTTDYWAASNLCLHAWWIEKDVSNDNYWELKVRVTYPYMHIDTEIAGDLTGMWNGPQEAKFYVRVCLDAGEGREGAGGSFRESTYKTNTFSTRLSRENINIILRHKLAPGHAHLTHDVIGKVDFGDSIFHDKTDYGSLWFDRRINGPNTMTDLRLPDGYWRAKVSNEKLFSIPVPDQIEWISNGSCTCTKSINFEKLVYLEDGYALDLWIHAVSPGDYNYVNTVTNNHPPLRQEGLIDPGDVKVSTVSGPFRFEDDSKIELSFISETEPVNDTIEI